MVDKQLYIVVESGHDYSTALDLAKCTDIVVPVFSCAAADASKIALDPHQHSHCYSETAYKFLSEIRVQGLSPTVGMLQGLNAFNTSK